MILSLQIIILLLFLYSFLAYHKKQSEYDQELARYRAGYAEYQKQMEAYKTATEKYNAALAEWQKNESNYTSSVARPQN